MRADRRRNIYKGAIMKIEGRNAVYELINSNKTIDKVFIENGLKDAQSRKLIEAIKDSGAKYIFCEKAVLDKESPTKKHQGFIAYASDFVYADLDDVLEAVKNKDGLILVLDGVEDTHNLGSIIRVADCAGVDAVIIGKRRSACVNDVVMRISEGSANHVVVAKVGNINDAVKKLRENDIWVYALELGGDNIYKANFKGKIALVIGGEDTGVNKLTKSLCDGVVAIPMFGKINSLNVSVATGVAVYEAVRQRNNF